MTLLNVVFDMAEVAVRLRKAVGEQHGDEARFAREIGVRLGTLNTYTRGTRRPPIEFLIQVAKKTGISIEWILTGKVSDREEANIAAYDAILGITKKIKAGEEIDPSDGHRILRAAQKLFTSLIDMSESSELKRLNESHIRSIPILDRVPEGPPGGEAWVKFDAEDIIMTLADIDDPNAIALRIRDDTMFPTLFCDDLVIISPQDENRNDELVVVEIEGAAEDYCVRRLAQESNEGITLLCDNLLQYPPVILPREKVEIRGGVIKVIRSPQSKPHRVDEDGLVEFYRSSQMQEIIGLMPRLSPAAREVLLVQIKEMAEQGL